MTHVYNDPIAVTLRDGQPATICWRGVTYRVMECNEPWRLMDRWWEVANPTAAPGSRHGRSERTYYRLRCAAGHDDLTCDIYVEAVSRAWVLERVYD